MRVKQQGKKLVTKSFIIQACPPLTEDVAVPRFGFIVTKKNGNAVCRNRIKRRFRALIQGYIKKDPHLPPLDYVIISRAGCIEEPFQDLAKMLEWAFKEYKTLFEKKFLKDEKDR